MKLKALVWVAAVIVLSGFTWGSDDSSKSNSTTSTSAKKTVATTSSKNKAGSYASSAAPTTSANDRVAAIRLLTAGTEAERKARLDSLTRVARSLSQARQAQAAKAR